MKVEFESAEEWKEEGAEVEKMKRLDSASSLPVGRQVRNDGKKGQE